MAGQFVFAQTLRSGMMGPDILNLQKALVEAGYLAREPEGNFGAATERAVALFQEEHQIRVTGVADEETLSIIENEKRKEMREGGGVVLTRGNRGAEVAKCQHMLLNRGYLNSAADGVYGEETEKAVRAFQKAEELPITGFVDEKTLEALNEDIGSMPLEGSLQQGSRGLQVKQVQKKLQQAGYLNDAADGVYGRQTVSAVRAFQRDRSLPASGKVDEDTWSALNERTDESRNLKQGDRGREVALLQNLLTLHGFSPGSMDGIYGGGTVNSVKKFQHFWGMEETGRADEEVWEKLHNAPIFRGEYKDVLYMRSTAYTPYDSGGTGRTARGNVAGKGHAAVDPNVIPLGSLIFIEGYGYALADDIGGSVNGHVVDVGVDTLDQAYSWGTRHVNVYIVE